MSIVDQAPFPWADPAAQQLHTVLCEMYPSSKGAMFVAARAGLQPAMLFEDQPAYLLWKAILELAASGSKVRRIVELVSSLQPDHPRKGFLEDLLAPGPVTTPLDAQPRGADGAPSFFVSNDVVGEREALLFHDDLTLPIGKVSWLIDVLGRLQSIAPSVCMILSTWTESTKRGTGFLIAPRLILTNWHVVHSNGVKATAVAAEFGFDDDGKGGGKASRAFGCNVQKIVGDAADDWAVIELNDDPGESVPVLPLSRSADPVDNTPAFVIQHPGGQRKRVAYVRNQITFIDERVVQYLSDTQAGSSGAPVLDEEGNLIALHHMGGRPQEVAGKPPLRKNEGIRISRVREGLRQRGVTVP